jgi:hypothetical protein
MHRVRDLNWKETETEGETNDMHRAGRSTTPLLRAARPTSRETKAKDTHSVLDLNSPQKEGEGIQTPVYSSENSDTNGTRLAVIPLHTSVCAH